MSRQASGIILLSLAFLAAYLIQHGSLAAVLQVIKDPTSQTSTAAQQAAQQAAETQLANQDIQARDLAQIAILQQQLAARGQSLTNATAPVPGAGGVLAAATVLG